MTDAALSVPFRVVDGRIYVTAKVDGKGPFVFAVDTGASGMGRADAGLVAALGIPLVGSGHTSDGVATAEVKTVHLASVDLGGFVRRDLEVATRDYSSKLAPDAAFSGILGREFFGDGLLVIDYPARRLTFTRAVALSGQGDGILPYERAFRVPVRIGDILTEGNLDTGANVSFVLPKTLFDRVGSGVVEPAGEGKLTNTTVRTGKAMVKGPFRIGAVTLSDMEVRVSDRYPELLVGAHALQHSTVLIDQRSKRIALCP
ncbi:MAG TPA: aspartyl protease family protein [Sphingomonas sanguinis]|uniref:aspartyl protease family protein n=1 Tax=Sphingomonas sanguinis TaxID=33051 RepID=UPI002AC0CC26|nr:aspartyl protease family protein [Sphingomonas sanguinis]